MEDKSDVKEAEILASANLALLTEMAGSKSHGFSTWALNPTIFDLVTSVSIKWGRGGGGGGGGGSILLYLTWSLL